MLPLATCDELFPLFLIISSLDVLVTFILHVLIIDTEQLPWYNATRTGPDCFNGVLSKVATRLQEYYAKYDVASRGRRKFAVLGEYLIFFMTFVSYAWCFVLHNALISHPLKHYFPTVGGGSFNPLTRMHLRTYFLAKQCLEAKYGYVVLGECLNYVG